MERSTKVQKIISIYIASSTKKYWINSVEIIAIIAISVKKRQFLISLPFAAKNYRQKKNNLTARKQNFQ